MIPVANMDDILEHINNLNIVDGMNAIDVHVAHIDLDDDHMDGNHESTEFFEFQLFE